MDKGFKVKNKTLGRPKKGGQVKASTSVRVESDIREAINLIHGSLSEFIAKMAKKDPEVRLKVNRIRSDREKSNA